MKKHFKFLSNSILATVAISSTAISSGLVLSSCTNTNNSNNDDNDNSTSNDIKIEDQSADNHEVTSGSTLTLFVNVASSKPVIYQWFIDKNDNKGWSTIEGATKSSYIISSNITESITTSTIWKYRAEIYDADDTSIKLTSNTYHVNIKPQSLTPEPNPEPNPDKPTNPEPNPDKPTNPDNNQSTTISSNSVILNSVGQLLPSQYLSDFNNLTIDKSLITERFDNKKITNVSYKVGELNDLKGTLSILMNYKEDNVDKSYVFDFVNLLNLENDNGYHLEFENATGILGLSAQYISEKTINSKADFEKLISELRNYNINFNFKVKGNIIPLKYLDLNSVTITGFDTGWFTSNSKLVLTFNFQNPKINYYIKTTNSNITFNSFDYPTNLTKKTTMEFYSAADYLLNKITNNNAYKANEYSSYYYYDIKNNEAFHAQLKVAQGEWLDNVITSLSYNSKNYVYKPMLNTSGSIDAGNGNLTINLKMEYQSETSSSNISSQTFKDITITGFASYNQNDLFSNSNNNEGKFSLGCESENYESNIQRLKSVRTLIKTKADAIDENSSVTFVTNNEIPISIINPLINSLNCKFSGYQLINQKNNDPYYYNDLTAIERFYIDPNDTSLRYNKKEDVFQLVVSNFVIAGVGVNENNYAINTNDMIINITYPGESLSKLINA